MAEGEDVRGDQLLKRVARQLKETIEEQGGATGGAVYFLDLEGVRDFYGAKWSQVAERVEGVTHAVLKLRLTEADLHTRQGELMYLLVFGRLGETAAQAKCALIADEIRKRLFGDESSRPLGGAIRTIVARLDKEIVLEEFNADQIVAELLGTGNSTLNVAVRPSQTPHAATPVSAPAVAKAAAAAGAGGAAGGPDWQAGSSKPKAPPREWSADADAPAAPLPAPGAGQEAERESWTLEFAFRPIWDVARGVVSTYDLLPASRSSTGALLIGGGQAVDADPSGTAGIDMQLLLRARTELERGAADGNPTMLGILVHYETIAQPRIRMAYLRACQAIDEEARRRLHVELVGMPPGAPPAHVDEIMRFLRGAFPKVFVQLAPGFRDLGPLRDAQVFAIGFDCSPLPEQKAMAAFKRLVDEAKLKWLKTYASGVNTLPLALTAHRAGINYLLGDAICPVVPTPAGMYKFTADELGTVILGDE